MDFSFVMTKAQNALRAKLALKLTVVLLAVAWLVYPQASIWQHAGQGVAVAGGWVRDVVIRGLGGDPHVDRAAVASAELDQLTNRQLLFVNGAEMGRDRSFAADAALPSSGLISL